MSDALKAARGALQKRVDQYEEVNRQTRNTSNMIVGQAAIAVLVPIIEAIDAAMKEGGR